MEQVLFTFTLEEFKPIFKEWVKEVFIETSASNMAEPQEYADNPLNIKQVAELTGLTVPTLYGYCQRGEIPYYKKGNRLFFFKSELLDWVKTGKQKTLKELEADAEGYLSKRKSNQLKLF